MTSTRSSGRPSRRRGGQVEWTTRAHACFAECLGACTATSYGLYRTNTASMEQAAAYGPTQMAVNQRLELALDPNGIIVPGKSGIHV